MGFIAFVIVLMIFFVIGWLIYHFIKVKKLVSSEATLQEQIHRILT